MKRPVVAGMLASFAFAVDIAVAQPTPPTQPVSPAASSSATPAETAPSSTAEAPENAPVKVAPRGALGSGSPEDKYIPVVYTRRGGFTIGTTIGLLFTSISGTPAQYEKRNDAYRLDTGFVPTFAPGVIFFGATFTDWFSFQLGISPNSMTRKVNGYDQVTSGGDFRFRLEAWPLFQQGGIWRDLGIGVEFGTGGATVKNKQTDTILADGGSLSLVGINAFWEAKKLWKFNFGPIISFDHRSSDTYSQSTFLIGLRSVFYTTP